MSLLEFLLLQIPFCLFGVLVGTWLSRAAPAELEDWEDEDPPEDDPDGGLPIFEDPRRVRQVLDFNGRALVERLDADLKYGMLRRSDDRLFQMWNGRQWVTL